MSAVIDRGAANGETMGQDAGLFTGSNAPARADRKLERAIGAQIREIRRHADLSIGDLAAAAGISTGMLSKIETGQISASLATLQAIAAALAVPITTLFASFEEQHDVSYVKSGEGTRIERRGTKVGHVYQLLGTTLRDDMVMEPYLITLNADAVPYTGFQHEGLEFLYMLSGELFYRHADHSYRLQPGDSLLFDSGALHGPESLQRLPATFLSIIVYQRAS